jgi:hypothetical protein
MNTINELQEKRALEPEQTAAIIKGGLQLGAGVAVLGALYSYARSNKRKSEAISGGDEAGGKSLDIVIPEASPLKMAYLQEPVIGALAAGGAYLVVSKLLAEVRKQRLKSELASAQVGYVGTLQDSVKPDPEAAAAPAGRPYQRKAASWLQALLDSPRDLMVLSALASAAGTYGVLENTFPKAKEKKPAGSINRIRIKGYGTVIADGAGDGPLGRNKKTDKAAPAAPDSAEEPTEGSYLGSERGEPTGLRLPVLDTSFFQMPKAAACLTLTRGDADRCARQLALIVTSGSAEKSASLLSAVLGYVHSEGPAFILEKSASGGLVDAADTLDAYHAVWDELDGVEKRAAVDRAFGTTGLSIPLSMLAMAELHDIHPELAKMAAEMPSRDPGRYAALVKFGSIMHAVQGVIVRAHEKLAVTGDVSADHDVVTQADGSTVDYADKGESEEDPIDGLLNPP